jgi:hypothetical protein
MSIYGKGTSPRKQMAMGGAGESIGTPSKYPGSGRPMHPDHSAGTGEMGAMDDGERGIQGGGISHSKGYQPAQPAPRHGPMHEKELGFDRGSKI